jgi:hypothetical protein
MNGETIMSQLQRMIDESMDTLEPTTHFDGAMLKDFTAPYPMLNLILL